jgi:type II secretory pathway component PulK
MRGKNGNWSEWFRFLRVDNKASILIIVLWAIALLGSFSVSMGYHVRQKITLADRIENRNFLYGVAEMGIAQALGNLLEKKKRGEIFHAFGEPLTTSERTFRGVAVGDGSGIFTVSYEYPLPTGEDRRMIYGIEDEAGKLNLNLAKAKTIGDLFQIISGLDEDEANEIAYSIVDWRDSNFSVAHPDYGAEDDYYEDLDEPYAAKDFAFQNLNELLLVRGMTMEIFERIKPYITIFGETGVNINTAPKDVLLALGCGEPLAVKIMEYRAGTDRVLATEDDRAFADATGIITALNSLSALSFAEEGLINRLVDEQQLGVNSEYFRIRSRAEMRRKKVAFEITAVADLEGKIYSWHSSVPRPMGKLEIEQAKEEEERYA